MAQSSGGPYVLNPQRIDGGGGRASGGEFELRGTLAQPEAGGVLAAASFELTSGLHRRAANAPPAGALLADGFEGS